MLKDPGGHEIDTISERIGWVQDHHVAEFTALNRGLNMAMEHGIQRIRVYVDSDLVFNTVEGLWNLKPEHLKPLRDEAKSLLAAFVDSRICWVPREMNKEADEAAGEQLRDLR